MPTKQQSSSEKAPAKAARRSGPSAAHEKEIDLQFTQLARVLRTVSGKSYTISETFVLSRYYKDIEDRTRSQIEKLEQLGRRASARKRAAILQELGRRWDDWMKDNEKFRKNASPESLSSINDSNLPIKSYSAKGRVLRKAWERPRPDLPSDAPPNRTRKQIALTLPPDLVEEVTGAAKDKGIDRTAFIEHALRMALKR